MWQHLTLSSLGVIDSAELELGPGFTVITGETGAGKTMVVTALGLLRGDRADLGLVRTGTDRARVEAEIAVPEGSSVEETVVDAGGQLDDGVVVLARSLSAQGRSRAFAGGATVPAGLLAEVTDELVAVHGQSDQHRLLRAAAQREALDRFAGEPVKDALAEYVPAYTRLRAIERRLDELRTHAQERARELDLLRHGLDEIAAVEPVTDEDEDLKVEAGRLGHVEALVRAALGAHEALASDDDAGSARDLVAAASAALDEAAGHDPDLDALAARVREVSIVVDDVAGELSAYADGVEVDPARLAVVQERIAALTTLQRKYGPTLADVLTWQEKAAARLTELDSDDDTVAGLEAERDRLEPEVRRMAARLSELRAEAGERLSGLVDTELAQLSMPSAHLVVRVDSADGAALTAHGTDDVELLFSANAGSPERPLAKGASGGELSRLMLALEVVLADRTTVPTLVFDEVDAGIGGKAAVEVGRRLSRLAEHAQVLAVTHLPQVAAFADHHFRVTKDDDGIVTSSSVVRLDESDRVDELARMLAGQEDSATAQAHARELLELARG
ncbi:DNA repair protein RecN [Aeromicrobium terrae]|uniref:DNA repair protein RecN n=1 Tax=Aeromicrobium terrae TaxID=2498846 RepID=A0A5C8NPL9_9ACTN|nr:DNA repair protein RecN [Aeromicrobium terrae]TXL63030.1 DNA repair protein RecN [Aeromicrobium terrae]